MRRQLSSVVVAGLAVATAACGPTMREYRGHTVFNPAYLFYLESPRRDRWQMPDAVLDALKLQRGDVVADIGAGGGYFTEKLARRVGPTGRVYATDVQPVMLRRLQARIARQRLTNVTVVPAAFDDPTLPAGACDLAFFSSTYKEIDDRINYLRKLRAALKPTGRIAILEYRPDAKAPGPPDRHRLTAAQISAELAEAGFDLQEQFDFLPREYFLVFGSPTAVD